MVGILYILYSRAARDTVPSARIRFSYARANTPTVIIHRYCFQNRRAVVAVTITNVGAKDLFLFINEHLTAVGRHVESDSRRRFVEHA
jgi:hypothetical protein